MTGEIILEALWKGVAVLIFLTAGFAYLTLFERRVLARFQVRLGPNRAGPFGILQPVADGIKLIFKEELIPSYADKLLFVLAPIITVIPSLIVLAVVPFGEPINLFGKMVNSYVADINVGLLYIMAVTSISVYGITLAGWSSNNKYAAMGGLRSTAQMISYEIAMGFCFIVPVLLSGSMSLVDIVHHQKETLWYIFMQPGAGVILFITMLAEVNRAPFDMPEAEQELTAGYHVEYSGMKFALFFMAEYIKMIAVSMIAATLYLGGYNGPLMEQLPILGPLWLFVKVFLLLFVLI
jgi:NADH-quinone oxidoreductase subunit H